MTPESLKEHNSQGFLAGPTEDLPTFLKRIETLKNKNAIHPLIKNKTLLKQLNAYEKWGFCADWIPVIKKSSFFSIWEVARTWIYEANNIKVPIIEIRKKTSYLQQEEILAHEAIHAVRCAFSSPKYEEIIAYQTSSNRIRKVLGPLFSNPIDSLIFIITSFIPLFLGLTFDQFSIFSFMPISLWSLYLSYQLSRKNKAFKKCQKKLIELFESVNDVNAITIRLSDLDIDTFAKTNHETSLNYIRDQTSLQWQQILASYPLKNFDIDATYRKD